MTLQTFGDQIVERAKLTIPKEFLDWGVVVQFANYGIQSVYPRALKQCKEFYQKSQAFTATSNSVPKPTDCQEILLVSIPGTVQGHATPIDVRQFDSAQGNPLEAGTARNPKYREDKNAIQLYPYRDANNVAFSGTFHYLRNIAMITDETVELSLPNNTGLPAIPWFYEEDAIMEALRMLRMRARSILDNPMTPDMMLANYDDMMAKLAQGEDPLAIYKQTVPGPLKSNDQAS